MGRQARPIHIRRVLGRHAAQAGPQVGVRRCAGLGRRAGRGGAWVGGKNEVRVGAKVVAGSVFGCARAAAAAADDDGCARPPQGGRRGMAGGRGGSQCICTHPPHAYSAACGPAAGVRSGGAGRTGAATPEGPRGPATVLRAHLGPTPRPRPPHSQPTSRLTFGGGPAYGHDVPGGRLGHRDRPHSSRGGGGGWGGADGQGHHGGYGACGRAEAAGRVGGRGGWGWRLRAVRGTRARSLRNGRQQGRAAMPGAPGLGFGEAGGVHWRVCGRPWAA